MTFTDLTYAAEDACDVCNAPGEVFREGKGLKLCVGCLILVARVRTGQTMPTRSKPKAKRQPASDSVPPPLLADESEDVRAKDGDPVP